jgi:hypothetical protein
MPIKQQIFAVLISVFLFYFIIDLVRRKRLREEYSWFWMMTGVGILVLALRYDWVVAFTQFIGAGFPTSPLFFFGIIFLLVVNIWIMIELTDLTRKMNALAQELALLKSRNHT